MAHFWGCAECCKRLWTTDGSLWLSHIGSGPASQVACFWFRRPPCVPPWTLSYCQALSTSCTSIVASRIVVSVCGVLSSTSSSKPIVSAMGILPIVDHVSTTARSHHVTTPHAVAVYSWLQIKGAPLFFSHSSGGRMTKFSLQEGGFEWARFHVHSTYAWLSPR